MEINMKNPAPIHLMAPAESRALGWQAESRDEVAEAKLVEAQADREMTQEGCEMTDTTEVQRYYMDAVAEFGQDAWAEPKPDPKGAWVRATDYDAQTAKLVEAQEDQDDLQIALASARKQLERYIAEAEAALAAANKRISELESQND